MQKFNFSIGYPNPLLFVPITQPDNWQELALEESFENLSPEAVLNSTKLVWQGSSAAFMNQYLGGGVTGTTNGIFEGIPLQVTVCASNLVVFDGIIDLTDPDTLFSCDIVQIKIRDKRMDMLTELIDSISISFLTSIPGQPGYIKPGNITNGTGDYVPIAYQRNDIPSLESIATLIMIIWDIYQIIEEFVDAVENAVECLIAAVGSYPAVGLIVVNVFFALLWIAYAALLIIILLSLTEAAINCLVSPVLQKYGMFVRDLLQRSCDYFGLQFSSTIFNDPNSEYYNAVIMPSKSSWEDNVSFTISILTLGDIKHLNEYDDDYNLTHGGNAFGYYEGTPGDLIRSLQDLCCAQAKITLNASGQPVLNLERWDYQYNLVTYTIPGISDQAPFNSKGLFNNTGRSQSAFGTNADEIIANYNLKYSIDNSDMNTLNFYDGTSCFAITSPNTVTSGLQKNVVLKNLKEITLEFSQAKRKETMTAMEEFFEDAYAVVYAIYVVNEVLSLGTLSLANLPSPPLGFNKTGHLLITGDITSNPKIFIAGPVQNYTGLSISAWSGRSFNAYTILPNNKGSVNMSVANLSTRSLFKNFHYSKLAISKAPTNPRYATPYTPGAVRYNQWIMYRDQEVPLCCVDYTIIKNNNFGQTTNGLPARIDSLKWKPQPETALIDYRVNVPYTKNLNVSFVVDGIKIYDISTI